MHKIKTFLIVPAIVVITAISFESIVMAAEVTRINKNRGLIVINGNKDDKLQAPMLPLKSITERQNKFGMEWKHSSLLK